MEPEFDRFADDYDELLKDPMRDTFARHADFYHRRKWLLLKKLLAKVEFETHTASWLDVGCGRAELITLGAANFACVVGCEPSVRMSQQSKVEVVRQSSPTDLPFTKGSFDLITAVCVFHHVKEPDRVSLAKGIWHVLKTGGLFCLIEHNPLNPATDMIVKRSPLDRGAKLLSSRLAKNYLIRAGFAILSTNFFLYLPEQWYSRASWIEDLLQRVPLGGQYAVLGRKAIIASQGEVDI